MRFILSGGGTAGHVYPALAVAEELLADGRDSVLFVGTPDGLEARLVTEAGIEFVGLGASGFDRARPLTLITSSARIAASAIKARRLLGRYAADAVIGFGGYVSLATGLAAASTRCPLVIQEQNAVPGMVNRHLSRWALSVAATYPESRAYFGHPERVSVTGNPIRGAILGVTRSTGRRRLGLDGAATVLLVFGGSRGARHLNEAVVALRDRLLGIPELIIVHVAGREEAAAVRAALSEHSAAGSGDGGRWRVFDYVDDMASALAAADLVVARAGATSIAEITALGLPALLVPYPYATDDHQTKNAAAMVDAGAAVLVPDSELDGSRFGDALLGLLGDPRARATMAAASRTLGRPDAARSVAELARMAATARHTRRRGADPTPDPTREPSHDPSAPRPGV